MKTLRHTETRKVKGITFTIRCFDFLEYSGELTDGGYEVECNGKTKFFWGYPTDSDLERMLTESKPAA